jgi:fatty-acyl-CoA synthase
MFFGDWLQRREMLSPNKVALIEAINNDQALTYRQWNHSTNRLAHYLRESLGVSKSDRVSIYASNRINYLETLPKTAANKVDKQQLNSQYGAEIELDAR